MLDAIYNKWKSKVVTGEEQPLEPGLCNFANIVPALEMLHKHILRRSDIVVHCDVDMDGFGCGYIIKKFLNHIYSGNSLYVANKEKEHGISRRQVEFFNKYKFDLVIIVDSSSNCLEYIKDIKHDVLVIDHHEILVDETTGLTNDGEHSFVIVNNMLNNFDNHKLEEFITMNNPNSTAVIEPFNAEPRMSCGLVVYELLRVYQEAFNIPNIIENLMLYQWAGVTLFTDAIQLLNDRNQWYITNTVHSQYTEPTLLELCKRLNKYNVRLTKTIIQYSLAPKINKAIRAGESGAALEIVLSDPSRICDLDAFKEKQTLAIESGIQLADIKDSYILCDITGSGISTNYTGVIAGKLCDTNEKNTVVFTVDNNGIAKGSFRGRFNDTDYREVFDTFSDTSFGQGHKQAFGFISKLSELDDIMKKLVTIEKSEAGKVYLTAGNVPDCDKGVYHIDNMNEFKRLGGIMMLANGNSKVSSEEQIVITVPSNELKLKETIGKVFIYEAFGMNCKAFSEVKAVYVGLYPEFNNGIDIFIK